MPFNNVYISQGRKIVPQKSVLSGDKVTVASSIEEKAMEDRLQKLRTTQEENTKTYIKINQRINFFSP